MRKITSTLAMLVLGISAYAGITTTKQLDLNQKVVKYMNYEITHNPRFTLKLMNISIKSEKEIHDGWKMYVLNLKLNNHGHIMNSPYVLFTNGYYKTGSLVNMNTHVALQNKYYQSQMQQREDAQRRKREKWSIHFKLPAKYYNKEHLLLGNIHDKNKIVLLSDPLCIACIGTLPPLLRAIEQSHKKVAVFYYDFSIVQLHPTSIVMAKLMLYAQDHGVKNVIQRVYSANFDKIYKKDFNTSVYVTHNPKIAVKAFNEVFHTHYTLKDIKPAKYQKRILNDMQLGNVVKLQGTPTILFDGTTYHSRGRIQDFLTSTVSPRH